MMKEHPKTILVFSEYYLPGFKAGGPIRSISNMIEWCGDAYNFKIITSDRDCQDHRPYSDITINEWNHIGKGQVFYINKQAVTPTNLYKILKRTDYDFIYFNSFFTPKFSILPLLLLKFIMRFDLDNVLLAPRGEFSEGALKIKSYKKKFFIWMTKILGIHKGINWQATDDTEKINIEKIMNVGDEKIFLMPNLPQKYHDNQYVPADKERNHLRIIYLSRVTPKKNLRYALEILQQIEGVNVVFDIYGLKDDDRYWKSCQRVIHELGDNITIHDKGVIPHTEVLETIAQYDLFFLPTLGENYGHAIYESFLAGTPVLISDQTPWKNLEDKELGWDISLTSEQKYIDVLRKLAMLDGQAMREKKEQVKKAIEDMDIHKNFKQNKKVFNALLS